MQKKILVVDNSQRSLQLLTHILEKKDFEVRTAEDGRSALEMLQSQSYHPDVIFIDLLLPHIDGERLCRMLRRKADFSSTLFVILSAVPLAETIDFTGLGADACIAKQPKQFETTAQNLQKKLTERLRITGELEGTARQWNNTFDSISDFVSIHDRNMKFVRVNRALAAFLCKAPEDLSGRFCYKIMHDRKNPWPDCPHLRAIETGRTVSAEIEDRHIGLPLLVTCSPLLHYDGSLMGSVHVARDISLEKKTTNERETLIRQLEETLEKVKLLRGVLPICASCKKIRENNGSWSRIEKYIKDHSEAEFSHSICPSCAAKLYPGLDLF